MPTLSWAGRLRRGTTASPYCAAASRVGCDVGRAHRPGDVDDEDHASRARSDALTASVGRATATQSAASAASSSAAGTWRLQLRPVPPTAASTARFVYGPRTGSAAAGRASSRRAAPSTTQSESEQPRRVEAHGGPRAQTACTWTTTGTERGTTEPTVTVALTDGRRTALDRPDATEHSRRGRGLGAEADGVRTVHDPCPSGTPGGHRSRGSAGDAADGDPQHERRSRLEDAAGATHGGLRPSSASAAREAADERAERLHRAAARGQGTREHDRALRRHARGDGAAVLAADRDVDRAVVTRASVPATM